MDYNRRLKEAQKKLNDLSYGITVGKTNIGDYGEWSNLDWERFIELKKSIALEFDVHEGDLKYT